MQRELQGFQIKYVLKHQNNLLFAEHNNLTMRYYFLLFILLIGSKIILANPGDTLTVRSHNRVHMNYYGSFDRWAIFPASNKKFERIWLKYTLSCPTGQKCSGWDYTNQIILRKRTGKLDSTLKQAPSFTVNGAQKDSFQFNYSPTYTYQYNSVTRMADTITNPVIKIIQFLNPIKPLLPTDTLLVYKSAYFTYSFDTTGKKNDSIWVQPDTTFRLVKTPYYSVFEVIDPFELMRLITPYASDKDDKWNYVYWADITDFSSILHDSAEIRSFYSGYSDGFAVTLDFIFIEGTPAREAYKIENLWNASYTFGSTTNPINNAIVAKNILLDSSASSFKLRFTPTGHGSDQGENCAEFCPKFYYVKLDNNTVYSQQIWNDQCGENALYPQTGTWIYNRANWCPGAYVPAYEIELNKYRSGKNNFNLDIDFEDYTAVNPSSTSYTLSSQLVSYKNIVYATDAALEEIVSPNNGLAYTRQNPSCNNAIFKVRNMGSDTIRNITFTYTIENSTPVNYTWYGKIGFSELTTITMPYVNWQGAKTNAVFKLSITLVNGKADEVTFNNSRSTLFNLPVQFPLTIIVETYTNKKPEENKLKIVNTEGKVIINRSYTLPQTWYRDTLVLGYGCYNLVFSDEANDGISWWANSGSVGTGVFRITRPSPYGVLRTFAGDFGSSLRFNFMAGSPLSVEESDFSQQVNIYPNPGSDQLTVSINDLGSTQKQISIYNIQGQLVKSTQTFDLETKIQTQDLPSSVYFIVIENADKKLVKKWVKE